jgi:hypothetical protein
MKWERNGTVDSAEESIGAGASSHPRTVKCIAVLTARHADMGVTVWNTKSRARYCGARQVVGVHAEEEHARLVAERYIGSYIYLGKAGNKR